MPEGKQVSADDKYKAALLALAKAQRDHHAINRQIGEALSASHLAAQDTWPKESGYAPVPPEEWKGGAKNGWLVLAYEVKREHYGSGVFDSYFANHDEDVEGYLAENCQHALRAHQLIQERKPIRKALGIAKRRVTFLANQLLKEQP